MEPREILGYITRGDTRPAGLPFNLDSFLKVAVDVVVDQSVAIRPLGLGLLPSEPRLDQQLVDVLYALPRWLLLRCSDALVVPRQEPLWESLHAQPATHPCGDPRKSLSQIRAGQLGGVVLQRSRCTACHRSTTAGCWKDAPEVLLLGRVKRSTSLLHPLPVH